MDEKYKEVQEWLSKVFEGQKNGPRKFEVTEQTLNKLLKIKSANEKAERDAQLKIEQMKEEKAYYAAEAKHMENQLKGIGLTPDKLSKEGKTYLDTLVKLAKRMHLSKPTVASILVEKSASDCKKVELDQRIKELTTMNKYLKKQMENSLKMLKELEETEKQCSEQTEEQKAFVKKKHSNINIHEAKIASYKTYIAKLEKDLSAAMKNPSSSHEIVAHHGEALSKLERTLQDLNEQLSEYEILPPDMEQAQKMLEDANSELEQLNKQRSLQMESQCAKH